MLRTEDMGEEFRRRFKRWPVGISLDPQKVVRQFQYDYDVNFIQDADWGYVDGQSCSIRTMMIDSVPVCFYIWFHDRLNHADVYCDGSDEALRVLTRLKLIYG